MSESDVMDTESPQTLIKLHYCNGKFFVWDIKDVSALRKNHRIVGTFTGSLPICGYQNTQLGLPLLLLPEEVKLLHEEGLIEVYVLQESSTLENDVKEYAAHQSATFDAFKPLLQNERVEEISRNLDNIVTGRRKRMRRAEDESLDREQALKDEINRLPEITQEMLPVQLFLKCAWTNAYKSYDIAQWNYPVTANEKLRCLAFKDMWSRGYFLTSGLKFGCDFLVYDGDPIMCHSKFMLVCNGPEDNILGMQLFIYGRLGSQVNKEVLIASLKSDDETYESKNSKITYVSFKWETNYKRAKTM